MSALLLVLTTAPTVVRAQTPADSAGVLLGVAMQLRAEGNAALSKSILDLIIERYAGTPAAAEALRLRTELRGARVEQSGRTELMVFGTAYGLWLGAAVPAALEIDNPTAYGVGLIVGAPLGFWAARSYARSRSLTEGQARAITFGGTWGTWQGLGWAQVLDLGARKSCFEFGCFDGDEPSTNAVLKSMIVGGLAGIGVGTALSHKNITAGTATTVNFGGLWGSWYGGALAAMADASGDQGLTATLIGGNVGIVAAAILAPQWQLSRQRARLISISGVAGLVGGLGALIIVRADSNESILVPIVTSAAGLALGAYWTRTMEPDRSGGQGLLDASPRRFGLEAPSIQPRFAEIVRDGRLQRVPQLGITLFQARF